MKNHFTLGELMDRSSIGTAIEPLESAHARERMNRAQTDRAWARQWYGVRPWWSRFAEEIAYAIAGLFVAGLFIMLMGAIASIGGNP